MVSGSGFVKFLLQRILSSRSRDLDDYIQKYRAEIHSVNLM